MACVLGISAYDASYLAAAEALQVPLVTEDRRLLAVAPQIAHSLRASLM
jgi:predicted nucleic acid-binding protein